MSDVVGLIEVSWWKFCPGRWNLWWKLYTYDMMSSTGTCKFPMEFS